MLDVLDGVLDVYIYILYTPRTWDWGLPFRFGKGSRVALAGAGREQEGARKSTEGEFRDLV